MNLSPSILTATGNLFNFIDTSENVITIEDIAHALSHICRFTGHSKKFYSVAQHSVLVSHNVNKEYALQGLLHDAAESVLGDVSSPLKQLLPEYKVLEKRIEKLIYNQFGLPDTLHPSVKTADIRLLVTEQRDLMTEFPDAWKSYKDVEPLPQTITPVQPESARKLFLNRYYQLTHNTSHANQ